MKATFLTGGTAVVLLAASAIFNPLRGEPLETGSVKKAVSAEALAACATRNDGMVNFIATRALMPKASMDASRLYRPSSDSLSDAVVSADGYANPIVIENNGVYMEFRADGLQPDTAKRQLLALCAADPTLNLPEQFKAQVVAQLFPPKGLIEIEHERAIERRNLRRQYNGNGATGIPSLIDKPRAP